MSKLILGFMFIGSSLYAEIYHCQAFKSKEDKDAEILFDLTIDTTVGTSQGNVIPNLDHGLVCGIADGKNDPQLLFCALVHLGGKTIEKWMSAPRLSAGNEAIKAFGQVEISSRSLLVGGFLKDAFYGASCTK